MADANLYRAADFNSLRWRAAEVTPNDGADLATPAAIIGCLVSGDIQVTASGGGTVVLAGVAGQVLPVLVDRVWATNTTATGIVALYGA
jgi:hypothetical protein